MKGYVVEIDGTQHELDVERVFAGPVLRLKAREPKAGKNKPAAEVEKETIVFEADKALLARLCAPKKTAAFLCQWRGHWIMLEPQAGGKDTLALRTEDQADRGKGGALCPPDQAVAMTAAWEGAELVFTPGGGAAGKAAEGGDEARRAELMGLDDAELQTRAAELGVQWNKQASKKTMVDRILEAGGK